jgi:hypothetical protein
MASNGKPEWSGELELNLENEDWEASRRGLTSPIFDGPLSDLLQGAPTAIMIAFLEFLLALDSTTMGAAEA